MRSAADEMRRVAARLRDQLHVDAGLDDAADIAEAETAVGTRIRELQAATAELRQLLNTLADLDAMSRFTEEGWPARRAWLSAQFEADPVAGLSAWLGEYCVAAAELRTGALARLADEAFGFPADYEVLVWRLRDAQRALAAANWRLAKPVLRALACGLHIGNADVPAPEIRAALRILLARIALALDEDPSEDLAAAEALAASTADIALIRAWAARRAGQPGEAGAYFADARAGDSSAAVIAELVRQRRETDGDAALAAARDWLSGVSSIVDILSQVERLIEPAPPELWLAVAERAADEHDLELAKTALDRAQSEAGDQQALLADICERRARTLAAADGDAAEVAKAWASAGDYRWSAGDAAKAVQHYRAALDIEPDNLDAALSEVGAQAWLRSAESDPPRDVLAALLGKVAELQAGRLDAATSWSLRINAQICGRLALMGEESSGDYRWEALLAIARGLIFEPEMARNWTDLAEMLGNATLLVAAVAAARRGFALSEATAQREELIRAVINVGDLDAGRELLAAHEDRSGPWIRAVDGFLRWHGGGGATAIELLRDATRDEPALTWARRLLMRAYLFSGEPDLAKREARQLRAYMGGKRDSEGLNTLAQCALISGDLTKAEQLSARLAADENPTIASNGWSLLGVVKLLTGRPEGVEDYIRAVSVAHVPDQLDDWARLDEPMLRALAAERGVPMPDVSAITDAVARRLEQIRGRMDPLAELRDAPAEDSPAAPQARALVGVLLSEATLDAAATLAALDAARPVAAQVPEWPRLADRVRRSFVADCRRRGDLDEAISSEQARLAEPAPGDRESRLAEIAELYSKAGRHEDADRALGAARDLAADDPQLARLHGDLLWRRGQRAEAGMAWETAAKLGASGTDVRLGICAASTDRAAAASRLHEAVTRSFGDTATGLHALLTEPADIEAVAEALREPESEPVPGLGAMALLNVLGTLPGELRLPEKLELCVPGSWFAGYQGREMQAPLLARYLPVARLRTPWLPGVKVHGDGNLEPDGYQVRVLGVIVEQDKAAAGADWVTPNVVPLLSAATQARADHVEPGQQTLVAVRRAEGADPGAPGAPSVPGAGAGLDALLLLSSAEILVLRVETAATAFRPLLG